jgi:hypothetical protein
MVLGRSGWYPLSISAFEGWRLFQDVTRPGSQWVWGDPWWMKTRGWGALRKLSLSARVSMSVCLPNVKGDG